MRLVEKPTAERLQWQPIPELPESLRQASAPIDRMKALSRAGQALSERLWSDPVLPWVQSALLQRVPYPGWYAFTGVRAQQVWGGGMIHLAARMLILQFVDYAGRSRTLLFNPHDIENGVETPFFKRLSRGVPRVIQDIVAPTTTTVPRALAVHGLHPRDIDYIAYDHLHTQYLRRWLGDSTASAAFPNARLLVHRAEWGSVRGLLPTQADWYCPGVAANVPDERVLCFEGSIQLGPGIALVHTPGHTAGNCSIVYRAPDGVRVSSENGVSSDSWYPRLSRVNAIRRYALSTGVEVILNGNTQESSVDQYLSMVLEKAIAGTASADVIGTAVPSSECTPHWLFRGAPTTRLWGDTSFGGRQEPDARAQLGVIG